MKFQSYILVPVVLASGALSARPAAPVDADKRGGADHPLVSRYAGSSLYQYGGESFGSVRMLVAGDRMAAEKVYGGRVTNKMYFGPLGVSPQEVFSNYQNAFRAAGFQVVYHCQLDACEQQKARSKMIVWPVRMVWVDDGKSNEHVVNVFRSSTGFHYLHVKKDGAGGATHIQVALRAGATDGAASGRVQQVIQLVEPAVIEQGKVAVDAKAITDALKSTGKVAVYGVHFDTNAAVIKPESRETLAEMAKALQSDSELNVYIVGHTDNVGNIDSNMALSKRRAQAVVEALTTRYGVAPGRVQSYGVASLSPTALNATEEGRAKNRRVEMVAR